MKNFKNKKIELVEMIPEEMIETTGGSEVTDAFWSAVGAVHGYTVSCWEIITRDSNNSRFR